MASLSLSLSLSLCVWGGGMHERERGERNMHHSRALAVFVPRGTSAIEYTTTPWYLFSIQKQKKKKNKKKASDLL